MPRETIVGYEKISKRYGATEVLRELTLSIAEGEKLSIIGPSGSGKSTLLRLAMALEKPDEGTLTIGGEPLWQRRGRDGSFTADRGHLRRLRARVGMVFQHFNLFPHMTALGNVTVAPIHVLGMSRDEAQARAHDLLSRVGLAEKADAWPGQLSGGQKQRVAIARALAMQPEVILFDEVTSALDPELVGEVLNVLRELAHESRMAMILVTHEMQFAREISDRVVFMDGGVVVEQGDPEALFTAPEAARTQEFLRAML